MDDISQEEVAGWAQRQGGESLAPDSADVVPEEGLMDEEVAPAHETLRAHAEGITALADQIAADAEADGGLHEEQATDLVELLDQLRATSVALTSLADAEEKADEDDPEEEELDEDEDDLDDLDDEPTPESEIPV